MSKTDDTLEYFKRLAEQPTSQEEIDEFYKRLEQRDEIEKIQEYIDHHTEDLRFHAKQVRCWIAQAEEDMKRILKERGEI